MRIAAASLVALFFTASFALADVESGPGVGEKVPGLKVLSVVGAEEGKEVDFVAERKDKLTVYLFVEREKFVRPVARFMKDLDGKLLDVAKEGAVVAVWITDDKDKTKDYLPKAQGSLKFDNTSLTLLDSKTGPEGWGVNSSADLTVVVTTGGKVTARYGFVSVNDTLVKGVIEEVKKAAEKK